MSRVNGAAGPALFHEGMLTLPEFTPQLELTCAAYGTPPPEVTWLRNGVILQNLLGRRVITVEDGGPFGELGSIAHSTLSLSEVQLSDAGEYTCRATSGNVSPIPGTTAWTFTFSVQSESRLSNPLGIRRHYTICSPMLLHMLHILFCILKF